MNFITEENFQQIPAETSQLIQDWYDACMDIIDLGLNGVQDIENTIQWRAVVELAEKFTEKDFFMLVDQGSFKATLFMTVGDLASASTIMFGVGLMASYFRLDRKLQWRFDDGSQ